MKADSKMAPPARPARRGSRRIESANSPAPEAATAAPLPASSTSRSWKQDLADVQRVGFWLWLGVLWIPSLSLSALSGPEVAATVLEALQSGSMGPKEAASIWQVLVLTAPFTSAVAVVGVGLLRGWFGRDDWFQGLYFATFVLLATTLVSKALSIGAQVEIAEVSPVNWPPLSWGINLAYSYYQVYTPWMLASSLAIGGFLAWTWSQKVMPHLQRGEKPGG